MSIIENGHYQPQIPHIRAVRPDAYDETQRFVVLFDWVKAAKKYRFPKDPGKTTADQKRPTSFKAIFCAAAVYCAFAFFLDDLTRLIFDTAKASTDADVSVSLINRLGSLSDPVALWFLEALAYFGAAALTGFFIQHRLVLRLDWSGFGHPGWIHDYLWLAIATLLLGTIFALGSNYVGQFFSRYVTDKGVFSLTKPEEWLWNMKHWCNVTYLVSIGLATAVVAVFVAMASDMREEGRQFRYTLPVALAGIVALTMAKSCEFWVPALAFEATREVPPETSDLSIDAIFFDETKIETIAFVVASLVFIFFIGKSRRA